MPPLMLVFLAAYAVLQQDAINTNGTIYEADEPTLFPNGTTTWKVTIGYNMTIGEATASRLTSARNAAASLILSDLNS